MAAGVREKLIALIEPLLGTLGFELVDLEFAAGRGHSQLRVFIDRSAGVGLDDCEQCSREIAALLDVHDPIPSAYTLEVSSPGLDRVLRTAGHFERFIGARVALELLVPREGRRRYSGVLRALARGGLAGADAGAGPGATVASVDIDVDGVVVTVRGAEIARARLVPEWPDHTIKGRKR